jgi:hypothetical protein
MVGLRSAAKGVPFPRRHRRQRKMGTNRCHKVKRNLRLRCPGMIAVPCGRKATTANQRSGAYGDPYRRRRRRKRRNRVPGKYYCHMCASKQAWCKPTIPSSLTGSTYQLGKFLKHTTGAGTFSVNSVFNDPSIETYENYLITTCNSGGYEVDDGGRVNALWFAGKDTGVTYNNGQYSLPTSGVKVVLHDNELMIHAFPVAINPQMKICCECCGPMPYDG